MNLREELLANADEKYKTFVSKYGEMYISAFRKRITSWGSACFYCHHYVYDNANDSVTPRDRDSFLRFVKEQGLRYEECYNGYGSRYYKVTL